MAVHYLHTMIRVRDLDRAIAFYQAAFGYALRARRPGPADKEIAFLHLAGEASELQLAWVPGPEAATPDGDALHLAYRVDDMAATRDAALAAGATPLTGPYTLPSGSIVAFIADPDGHAIELVQKPA